MATAIPTLICVVGARPNFMKMGPILASLATRTDKVRALLVHTGQHYDAEMKATFFDQLGIPEPDVDLGVGSGSHAVQTAQIMLAFEPVIEQFKPRVVLVVGDVNSTIACGLVAVKRNIPLVHVEAGLRSRDRTMPEEINRILTDQIADLLLVTEKAARDNLLREGIDEGKIHFVGNVMIDSLFGNLPAAVPVEQTIGQWFPGSAVGFPVTRYALLTLHRPSNVDDPTVLARILQVLAGVAKQIPVVFPVHPRTRRRIAEAGLEKFLQTTGMYALPPVGYLQMLGLMKSARMVLTDSGGIQEETTALGIPCVTLRENTERPITVRLGTNTLVGSDAALIVSTVEEILASGGKAGHVPELWDGRASQRIVELLEARYFM